MNVTQKSKKVPPVRPAAKGNAEKILATAEKLMSKNGISETSLADIAQQAKISRGTLFYYYKSKDDLICDVAEKHMDDMTAQLVRMVETDTSGDILKMTAMLIKTIALDHTRGRMHHYLLHEIFNGNKTISTRLRSSYSQWKKMLTAEFLKMGLSCSSASAELIIAALDGLIIQSMLGITENDPEDYAHIMTASLRQ